MNLLTKRLTVPDVVRTTGFIKKEEALLEKAARLATCFENERKGRGYVIVGGFATRVYVSAEHKGRIGNGSPTDIDVAFLELPRRLRAKLNEERLIESVDTRLTTMCERPIGEVKQSPFSVFHLKPELANAMPVLDDVCFFERTVGPILVRPVDILSARTIEMYVTGKDEPNGVNCEGEVSIRIADPGFVLATAVNPAAITDTRSWRAILILGSLPKEEFDAAIERYADIVKASGIEQLDATLITLRNMARKKGFRDKIEEFIERVRARIAGTAS